MSGLACSNGSRSVVCIEKFAFASFGWLSVLDPNQMYDDGPSRGYHTTLRTFPKFIICTSKDQVKTKKILDSLPSNFFQLTVDN